MNKREDRRSAGPASVLALACAVLTASCEGLVGADFESAHPSSDAGGAGRDSSSGGSGAGGMDGAGPADAGSAGSTAECRENRDCIESHAGEPYVCRRNRCVELLSGDDCPLVIPELTLGRTALEQLRDDDPILIGAYSELNLADPRGSSSVMNWELALLEFNERLLGGLPQGNLRRPLLAVVCQARQPRLEVSVGHLLQDLEVPAVLSALPADRLFDALALANPDGPPPALFMSALSADRRLANHPDGGMVWHVLGSPHKLAAPTVRLLERTESIVNERRLSDWQNREVTGIEDDPETPFRVLMVRSDFVTVDEIATELTTSDPDEPQNVLRFNGASVFSQQNAESFESVLIQSSRVHTDPDALAQDALRAVESAKNFLPHAIVVEATEEFANHVLPHIEDGWPIWTGEPASSTFGQRPPFYILPHVLFSRRELLTQAARFDSIDLASRMVGVNYAQSESAEKYNAYLSRLEQRYGARSTPTELENHENFYDAVYYVLYALAAANASLPAGRVPRGADVRAALEERVLFGAQPVDIGPGAISDTVRSFADAEYGIQLMGTLGPPNFDRSSGTRSSEFAAWCVDQPPPDHVWQFETDVSRYDDVNHRFKTEFSCETWKPLTLAEACARQCENLQDVLAICPVSGSCEEYCRYPIEAPEPDGFPAGCPDDYVSFTRCSADLTPDEWECSAQEANLITPAPVPNTECEAELCAWSCCEKDRTAVLVDRNVLIRCGCPSKQPVAP